MGRINEENCNHEKERTNHDRRGRTQSRAGRSRGRSAREQCTSNSESAGRETRRASGNWRGHFKAGDGTECSGGEHRRSAVVPAIRSPVDSYGIPCWSEQKSPLLAKPARSGAPISTLLFLFSS